MLGLRCCEQAFSSCSKRGLLFIAVHGLLTAVASLAGNTGSRHTGSVVLMHGLCCSMTCGIFLDQVSEPMCPALQGGFLIAAPSGKTKFYQCYLLSCFSCVWLFVTLWTVALQAPLSMWFSRQERWSGLPFPSPENFPNSGIKPRSPMSSAWTSGFFTTNATCEVPLNTYSLI